MVSPRAQWKKSKVSRTALDTLVPLARRQRFVLAHGLACAVLAAAISMLLPVRYTASTSFLVPKPLATSLPLRASEVATPNQILQSDSANYDEGFKYVEMLRSDYVEDALVDQFQLKKVLQAGSEQDARQALVEESDIRYDSLNGGFVRISVTEKDPDRAARMANAYVLALDHLLAHIAEGEDARRSTYLAQQVNQNREDLLNAEGALQRVEETRGLIRVPMQSQFLIARARDIRAHINADEVYVHALEKAASAQNPELLRAREDLRAWEEQLQMLEKSPGGKGSFSRTAAPGSVEEFNRHYRDVEFQSKILEMLELQYQQAKLDETRQGSPVQVVDVAVLPDRRSYPKRTRIVLIGFLTGLMVGVFQVLLQASFAECERRVSGTGPACAKHSSTCTNLPAAMVD